MRRKHSEPVATPCSRGEPEETYGQAVGGVTQLHATSLWVRSVTSHLVQTTPWEIIIAGPRPAARNAERTSDHFCVMGATDTLSVPGESRGD